MSAPFDLLLFGRRKIAAAAGSSPNQQTLTKVRLRIVQKVFNDRRLAYQNRIEANRRNLVLSTIENTHKREQATQRVRKESVLTDLKRKDPIIGSCLALLPFYEPIDLTEPKDFYRFGVRVQSAGPHVRSRPPEIRSDLIHSNRDSNQLRVKSASTVTRSNTMPCQTSYNEEIENDAETTSVSDSRMTSSKSPNDRATSAVSSTGFFRPSIELPSNNSDTITSTVPSDHLRITWPVRLRVFALQDEDEARQQFLAWRAEKRKARVKESPKQYFELDAERQYNETLRRRQEIDAFITPDLIAEHQLNDPVFAKRYRQLKLAVRIGKVPNYDPKDREINITMTKSKMDRARTALITAKKSQQKDIYRNQQIINNANLSKRIDTFLKNFAELNEKQKQKRKIKLTN